MRGAAFSSAEVPMPFHNTLDDCRSGLLAPRKLQRCSLGFMLCNRLLDRYWQLGRRYTSSKIEFDKP